MKTPNKPSIFQTLKLWFVVALLGISLPSQASDDYYDYLSDLHLHESHQARVHPIIIKYSDGDNGQLLRSVLNPRRVTPALSQYFIFQRRGDAVPDLPQLLAPLIRRCETAFNDQPRAFEAEYLDSLEVSVAVVTGASATVADVSATLPPPSTQLESQQKALLEASQKFLKTTQDIGKVLRRSVAASIRKKVDSKLFSEEGAKRALALADKFESQ